MRRTFSSPQHEPNLSRDERRARGIYYTPREIADWIVAETYGPLLATWNGDRQPPRLLDPACGGGVFLQAAMQQMTERCRDLGSNQTKATLRSAIFGQDIDPEAITKARTTCQPLPAANFSCTDTLCDEDHEQYDAIVGNPPYVSIRELARGTSRDYVHRLRDRYQTARGNFDLYAPFWERSLELLRPGGRLGFIVPNKWNTLDYAEPLRALLLSRTTIEQIIDASSLKVFPQASTYPQIVILRKESPTPKHHLRFRAVSTNLQLADRNGSQVRQILQRGLSATALVLGNDIAVESRVTTQPLGQLCELHSGASGYSAQQLATALHERDQLSPTEQAAATPFIVSGNVDRYAVHVGPLRFLNRAWQQPYLPLDANCLTDAKRQLYREPKLVFSGMCQLLETAYDARGLALGVQVFAACEFQLDPYYLLGLLNSKILSYLFRERFAAKRLGGGYLAINKGQLAQLPIALPCPASASRVKKIAKLARQLSRSYSVALDAELDALTYDLYCATPAERRTIEASFAPKLAKRAA